MKKLFFLVAIATTTLMTSCVKNKEIYQGDQKQFVYTPSYIQPTMVGIPVNGIATINVGGKLVSVQCLTPSQDGDMILVDAPIVPQSYEWDQYSNEYKPVGFRYNEISGFSSNYCAGYFVEIFANGTWRFWNGVAIPWSSAPNPASWVNSFEYPRTWVDRITLPYRGKVVKIISNGSARYGASM
jgi:hypothetical protein